MQGNSSKENTNMTTPSGHTNAIRASRVIGTNVYNSSGSKIGEIEDVILEKMSDRILFAVVGFGGLMGMGERFHAVPWATLDYDEERGGYTVPFTREQLERAPADTIQELTADDGKRARDESFAHYGVQA
jgi:sporulation protein YlmC with PRC-barrel domain